MKYYTAEEEMSLDSRLSRAGSNPLTDMNLALYYFRELGRLTAKDINTKMVKCGCPDFVPDMLESIGLKKSNMGICMGDIITRAEQYINTEKNEKGVVNAICCLSAVFIPFYKGTVSEPPVNFLIDNIVETVCSVCTLAPKETSYITDMYMSASQGNSFIWLNRFKSIRDENKTTVGSLLTECFTLASNRRALLNEYCSSSSGKPGFVNPDTKAACYIIRNMLIYPVRHCIDKDGDDILRLLSLTEEE